ncbi:MAG TPA: hypothetical protein VLK34_03570 [Nocardioidaceae bacterium]|nr:hypothetical protein [Nocardioidaceae bacterium]
MAGRELIRELHEASYRRLAIELLAHADDVRSAEDAARDAFADAYRHGRAVDDAVNPHDELRQAGLDAIGRRARRDRLLARLRLRRPAAPAAGPDPRLSGDANETLAAVSALPRREREAAVLHYLAGLPDADAASTMRIGRDEVQALLQRADAALRAGLGRDPDRASDRDDRRLPYRQRLDDLAIDLRHAIGMPPFDDVVATATRRRRRLTATVAAAALVVGGGIAVSVVRSDNRSSIASNAALSDVSRETAAVRAALQSPGTNMYAVARNPSGVWASFWFCRSCAIERSFALLSRDGFLHVQVVPLTADGQGDAWATPTGDFVVSSGAGGSALEVISPDGAVNNLEGDLFGPPRSAGPGDLVVTAFGVGLSAPTVIDSTGLKQWPLRIPSFHDPGGINIVQSHPDGGLRGFHLPGPRHTPGIVTSPDGGRTWSSYLLPQAFLNGPTGGVTPVGEPLISDGTVAFMALLGRSADTELVVSHDAGRTWLRSGVARDDAGRPIQVYGAMLAEPGSLVVTGLDADGDPQVWVGNGGIAAYHSLRPVLPEAVSFARPPLDTPNALWATAPQAIWESDNGGRTWYLLISHLTWQNIIVVGDGPAGP